ncbi:acyl-CoA hydrolase [Pandoraea apista]|uniref:Acyl-CoA hydrolase n=4 Tax=Pandoraea TaxID=93217 RepID=A0A5E5PCR4_9BURK|nr:putative acyl-CoA thioester hydrolase [Pandoraea apista]VVG73419.1 acyl-CoA hydrolase [Pandoraea apista]
MRRGGLRRKLPNRSIIAHPPTRSQKALWRPGKNHQPAKTNIMNTPQNQSERSEVTFRFLAEPAAVNFGGKVHGGSLMKWIDEVAYACAATWSGRYCVTVSVGNIRFRRPILVGNLVELRARIVATGRTSMHIHVSVHAGDPKWGELRQTTDCLMVFVAVDESNHPVSVPSFEPKTEEQKALAKYAMDVKAALDAIVELKPENVAN